MLLELTWWLDLVGSLFWEGICLHVRILDLVWSRRAHWSTFASYTVQILPNLSCTLRKFVIKSPILHLCEIAVLSFMPRPLVVKQRTGLPILNLGVRSSASWLILESFSLAKHLLCSLRHGYCRILRFRTFAGTLFTSSEVVELPRITADTNRWINCPFGGSCRDLPRSILGWRKVGRWLCVD